MGKPAAMIHVYTGDGKGKTIAAFGLALRAWGNGWRILVVQFMKSGTSGELTALQALGERVQICSTKPNDRPFIWLQNQTQRNQTTLEHHDLFRNAQAAVAEKAYDLVILDEIMSCIASGDVSLEDVLILIRQCKNQCELVLTGRNAPPEITELADYVSSITAVKHPFTQGIAARPGIEF